MNDSNRDVAEEFPNGVLPAGWDMEQCDTPKMITCAEYRRRLYQNVGASSREGFIVRFLRRLLGRSR